MDNNNSTLILVDLLNNGFLTPMSYEDYQDYLSDK